MENAVKALYIAAGMLLGVMILGVWVYIFRQGASLGQNYEADQMTLQIQAFNSQFEKYSNNTRQRGAVDGFTFIEKGNIPSDVITCANLAYNINEKNDFDETNCVEVEVRIGSKRYYVHSANAQPKNYFLIGINKTAARTANAYDTANTSICKNFYNFLKDYNEVKIVNINAGDFSSSSETIYKYYFDVKSNGLHYNENTGKVDSIIFTAYTTKGYDTNGGGKWSENL